MGAGIILLLILLTAGYLLRYRSAEAVDQLIKNLSNGEYKLQSTSFRFNLFRFQINAKDIRISPTVQNDDNSVFEFHADSIAIGINNPIQLLLFKRLSVNRLILKSPYLELRTQKKDSTRTRPLRPLHIEIAAVQDVFFDVLSSLEVQRFRMTDAAVAIYPETAMDNRRFFLNHINLALDDLHLLRKFNQWDNSNRVNVDLQLLQPTIEYPDSSLQVVLDRLIWQTQSHRFDLSGLDFHKRVDNSEEKSGFRLENIELDSLNWNKLLTEGRIELGLLKASKGFFTSNNIRFRPNPAVKSVRVENSFLDVMGPIHIRKLEIDSIEFTGTTISRRGREKLAVLGDNFTVSNLTVDNDLPNKIELDDLEFAVRGFIQSDSNKSFQTGFDGMRIRKNQLTLHNYFLRAMNRTNTGRNSIEAKQMVLHNLSIPALLNGRLQSEELYLIEPTVRLELSGGRNPRNGQPIQELQRNIRRTLQIETIRIYDADLMISQVGSDQPIVKSDSFSAIISSNSLLRAGTLEELFGGNNRLAMPRLAVRLKNFSIDLQNTVYENNRLSADHADGRSLENHLNFQLNNVQITDLNPAGILASKDTNWIRILEIGSGDISMKIPEKTEGKPGSKALPQDIVRIIRTGQINLHLETSNGTVHTKLDSLSVDSLRHHQNKWDWYSHYLSGRSLNIKQDKLEINSDRYHSDSRGTTSFQNLRLNDDTKRLLIAAEIPNLIAEGKISSLNDPISAIHKVRLEDAVLDFTIKEVEEFSEEDETSDRRTKFPAMELTNPDLHVKRQTNDSLFTIFSSRGGHFSAAPIHLKDGSIRSDKLELSLRNLVVLPDKIEARAAQFDLKAENFHFDKFIEAEIEHISIKNGDLAHKTDRYDFAVNAINLSNRAPLFLSSAEEDRRKLFQQIHNINLQARDAMVTKGIRKWELTGPRLNADHQTIELDSIRFMSTISKDSFFRQAPWQTDFIEFSAGKSRILGFAREIISHDTIWKANRLELDQLNLMVERDKRVPADSVSYRPMLPDQIRKIPISLQIGSTVLTNARVQYNEIAGKTGKMGSVWFGNLNLVAGPIKNYQLSITDSLSITANANFMDQGYMKFAFRQSYLDSLKSFLLLARMGRFDLNAMSPLLLPLYNVNITKGYSDSLWLRVKGNDHFAYGHMELDYSKLKFEILKEDGSKQKTTSFLANLLIRNRNDKKGLVYQSRIKNKSTFNYWGKIALSGLMSNLGVKSDRKSLRKYKKEARRLKLSDTLFETEAQN